MKITAILTCFNRSEKTKKCLESLFKIIPDCDVFITDDGSTDGTSQMLHQNFPQVHVITGNGKLFWSRGMYTAWKEAVKKDYDFYLWLNDDIELYPYFFDELQSCYQACDEKCIITGLIENFEKTEILYGGSDSNKTLLQANGNPQKVTFMNGNVVLIPQNVVNTIGIMDPKLHHDLGDVDYGLTAIEHGIGVYTTRKPIAAGYKNDFCRVRKWGVSLKQRLKKLNSPLGSPPALNFYFRKKHFGLMNACAYWAYLYILNILPDSLVELIWGDAYKDKK